MKNTGTAATILATLVLSLAPLRATAKNITLMSYNVENLFDTFHDEGKSDYTYQPLAYKKKNPQVFEYCRSLKSHFYRDECYKIDWTLEKLNKKLESLTRVLKLVGDGSGPDIIALQEVENLRVLNYWMKRHLSEMGYREVVLLEGPDDRGIDGAILSKFPLASEPIYHDFIYNGAGVAFAKLFADPADLFAARKGIAKRGVLEARFKVSGGAELAVLSNHWPSQANPSSERQAIAKLVHDIAEDASQEGRMLVSMGDYNTLETDSPHGMNEFLLNSKQKGYFLDARTEATKLGATDKILPGSHWYRGDFSALDKILVLASAADEIKPLWETFNVVNAGFMMEPADEGRFKLKPKRFDFGTADGFADHLPITMDLGL